MLFSLFVFVLCFFFLPAGFYPVWDLSTHKDGSNGACSRSWEILCICCKDFKTSPRLFWLYLPRVVFLCFFVFWYLKKKKTLAGGRCNSLGGIYNLISPRGWESSRPLPTGEASLSLSPVCCFVHHSILLPSKESEATTNTAGSSRDCQQVSLGQGPTGSR